MGDDVDVGLRLVVCLCVRAGKKRGESLIQLRGFNQRDFSCQIREESFAFETWHLICAAYREADLFGWVSARES